MCGVGTYIEIGDHFGYSDEFATILIQATTGASKPKYHVFRSASGPQNLTRTGHWGIWVHVEFLWFGMVTPCRRTIRHDFKFPRRPCLVLLPAVNGTAITMLHTKLQTRMGVPWHHPATHETYHSLQYPHTGAYYGYSYGAGEPTVACYIKGMINVHTAVVPRSLDVVCLSLRGDSAWRKLFIVVNFAACIPACQFDWQELPVLVSLKIGTRYPLIPPLNEKKTRAVPAGRIAAIAYSKHILGNVIKDSHRVPTLDDDRINRKTRNGIQYGDHRSFIFYRRVERHTDHNK
ncbi:hypothetical protein K474DRAFT_1674503 [Panus rudis PR-1116 ss-1]|nr:hypothetical protein K474DRAFT_1674503 [Panus rudis PR-1116 ss-1]